MCVPEVGPYMYCTFMTRFLAVDDITYRIKVYDVRAGARVSDPIPGRPRPRL